MIYVNDLPFIRNYPLKVDLLEQELEKYFEMSKLEILTFYIGIKYICITIRKLFIQEGYSYNLIKIFSMLDSIVIIIWIEEGTKLNLNMDAKYVDATNC